MPKRRPHKPLSHRELEIIRLYVKGNTYPKVAEELGISFATVRTYANRVLAKLNASTMVQAVAILYEEGSLP